MRKTKRKRVIREAHPLTYLVIISMLVLYTTICILFAFTTEYFAYHSVLKTLRIALPIISAFAVTFIFPESLFPNKFIAFKKALKLKDKSTKFASVFVILFSNFLSIFFLYQFISTEQVLIRSNADTYLVDQFKRSERKIGLIPENTLAKIRVKRGKHQFIFSHKKQRIIKSVTVDTSRTNQIDLHFNKLVYEILEIESAEPLNMPDPTGQANYSDAIDFKRLFQEKKTLGDDLNDINQIVIEKFEIAKDYSIYEEDYSSELPDFKLSFDRRTFFETDEDDFFQHSSDYGDLITITDKIAQKVPLTSMEKAFLERAKPVFEVVISNRSDLSVLMTGIILKVKSVERVLGGGTKVLRPEIMYEIEVPTEVGIYTYSIKNQLMIDQNSFAKFYLGLNSTNKRVLSNGAVLFPQIDYELEIYFQFGNLGRSNSVNFKVLL